MYSTDHKIPSPQNASVSGKEQPTQPLIVDLDDYPAFSPDLTSSPNPQKIQPHDLIKEVKREMWDTLLKLQRKATHWLTVNN